MKAKIKSRVGLILILIGLLALIGGIALGAYNLLEDKRAGEEAEAAVRAITHHRETLQIDEQAIPDYILNPNMDMPAIEVDGRRYVGTVEIPVIALDLPVLETWNYPNLRHAPCRYAGTAYLNDMIICAHNYTNHFGRLRNLIVGDTVVFTDTDGNEFYYEVAEIENIEPTEIEQMESGDWDLTLFTCTIGGQIRLTIRCDRIN